MHPTDTPILFKPEMIVRILEGRKTQTRRIMKPQPPDEWTPANVGRYHPTRIDRYGEEYPGDEIFGAANEDWGIQCYYGQPGDRLWVREPFWICAGVGTQCLLFDDEMAKAPRPDAPIRPTGGWAQLGRHPSIHMPKWACRLWLELTAVRVERVQAITSDDAVAEGMIGPASPSVDPVLPFRALWNRIHGAAAWNRNEWVWVLTFRRTDRAS